MCLGQAKSRPVIIACQIMEPELGRVRNQDNHLKIHYLDQGLHRFPKQMPQRIQERIDQVAEDVTHIVLGYGLCSNGIVGVAADDRRLIVPRCHDCITVFLGSTATYEKSFSERPGTYYLTPGWIQQKKDPLSIIEEEYAPRYGRETAVWVLEEELKHYTHIALIDTGVRELDGLRARAMENARFLRKQCMQIPGSLEYFKKLLLGPYTAEDFLVLEPGERVTQDMFLDP